uniref:Leukotriene B4 receptor n=2 Tax=Astyanax mexicanus TaxID=7994 RepID=A0A3B1JX68_ASTMX
MASQVMGTNITNPDPCHLVLAHKSSRYIGIVILVLAFVLGFPGNLFVAWSVLCRVKQRSVTCLLVLNLAVADAFVLLSAPLFLRLLAVLNWEFGDVMCKTVHYLCCVNMYVSIYLICLMSLDRWLAVSRPFLSQKMRNKRTIYMAMLGIWIMAFLLALPMLFYRSNRKLKNTNVTLCMPLHSHYVHTVFQYLFETLMGFVVPFTFIVSCYSSVICRLRSAMFRGRVKGSLLILLIISAFSIFWIPYHLINILEVIGAWMDVCSLKQAALSARPNVTAFAFLSSSVNPVLYVFAGSSYIRDAGFSFMARLLEGTHSDQASVRSRRLTSTDNSIFTKLTIKAVQNGERARNKSSGDEEKTKMEKSCVEEVNTLTTMHITD